MSLNEEKFFSILKKINCFEKNPHVAVGVSGGPDSIALVFLIFDVEVIFLYPWAVVYNDLGLLAFIEVMIFLTILIVGFAYVWVKDDLSWVKMSLKYAQGRYSNLQKKDED